MSEGAAWQAAIDEWVSREATTLTSCAVVEETTSTQDVARERFKDGESFGAVTALRQTAGRGRLGREWADTASDGVAITFALPDRRSEPLIVLSAVAAARAIETAAGVGSVQIKWPNDLILRGRKLGGILIERPAASRPVALVGIGINVGQREFPPPLAERATSLALQGLAVERLTVVVALFREIDRLATLSDDVLLDRELAEYLRRDALRGATAAFATPDGEVVGRVATAHPIRGITVESAAGPRLLSTATTTVLSWQPAVGDSPGFLR